MAILDRVFGYANTRVLNALKAKVDSINGLESKISKLTDEELKAKTLEFRKKIAEGREDQPHFTEVTRGEEDEGFRNKERRILDEILPEAFAVMREAMKRVWGERHFDVQLMGGVVLHQGKIAEMKTGEGKTIVAALPLYLNSLTGRGVHLVTVNDYLSKAHGEAMGEVYNFMGLSTGVIQSNQETYKFIKKKDYKHYSEADGSNLEVCSRKEAYACDVTYGTNNEFGFDYLRDNMAPSLGQCAQRELNFAIVDEVDSILIDEARTPLIISAPAEDSGSLYQRFSALIPRLKEKEDYVVDEKERVSTLTDAGIKKMEALLGIKNIYENDGMSLVHHLEEALKAHALFKKDRDYVVREGEVIIVDEFTGRLMVGRRYSGGLHQAIEAKEGVEVKKESQTLATVSFQNLFRLYAKLAGMTGTAATEAEEFYKIYKLDVVEIPTNKAVVRKDLSDRIYKSETAKFNAVIDDIKMRYEKGQPILAGTVSVEKNETLSKLLRRAGIKHEILNAKNHEREAKIIMKAGQKGAVTVATNMAGRGTDIKLGQGVRELGGLHVIGTERHEARRIDNQLRGRSGRQGDPGSSQFYVSMEDDLMRIFGGERMKNLMNTLGLPDDMPIENKMISRSIESAQKKVEGHNFDIRKHLVEYDDVMNKHREAIYKKRRRILELESAEDVKEASLKDEILDIVDEEIESIINFNLEDEEKARSEIAVLLGIEKIASLDIEEIRAFLRKRYDSRQQRFGPDVMRQIEKAVYLRTIDMLWIEHLTSMEELRTGIGLRGYGQRDPLVEYKHESYNLYQSLIKNIENNVAKTIFRVEVQTAPAPAVQGPIVYGSANQNDIGGLEDEIKELAKEGLETEEVEGEAFSQAGNIPESVSGVTTVIREKGKTVYDRINESSGPTGAYKNRSKIMGDDGKAVKVGRNDPCPCGAAKTDGRPVKYKHCHGK